ncbi:MAG TPA: hypothetical protein PK971_03575, partial [Saprospiraceae bacterium]|nr:hypothetical protein [Saprospiraceae bacterium]HND87380.1 hypothetical protein [Saprospiraceae bacterium]
MPSIGCEPALLCCMPAAPATPAIFHLDGGFEMSFRLLWTVKSFESKKPAGFVQMSRLLEFVSLLMG